MTYHSTQQLIEFAKLLHHTHIPFKDIPEGWKKIDKVVIPSGGFYANIYSGPNANMVMSISGQRPHRPRFLWDMIVTRRILSRYNMKILDRVMYHLDTYPQRDFTFIGASGGGGVASWLGWAFKKPSVSFNGGRTKWSLLNDGTKQDIVYVKGDGWGDPYNGRYGMPMPGNELVLEQEPGKETHHMSAIIELLEKL